jgi:IclR family transcriptional regulator, KDG regulon repressor
MDAAETPFNPVRADSRLASIEKLERTEPPRPPNNRSVEHALAILDLLAAASDPVRLTDVAREVGITLPTASRLVSTLEAHGYAAQDPATRRYTIGLRAFGLGQLAAAGRDLRAVALPHMRQLNEATGEVVHLGVYHDGAVVYVEKLDSRHAVAPSSAIGSRAPAACVATGKSLLAHQSHDEIDRVIGAGLRRPGGGTVSPEELAADLEETRRRGYAVNRESWREGVSGVAAPVRDHTGIVQAGVGCCLPSERLTAKAERTIVTHVLETAAAISTDLGFHFHHGAGRPRE